MTCVVHLYRRRRHLGLVLAGKTPLLLVLCLVLSIWIVQLILAVMSMCGALRPSPRLRMLPVGMEEGNSCC